MRGALSDWLARTPDWSDVSEREMVARFESEGSPGPTATPILRVTAGEVSIRSETEGASLGVRIDDGRWQLYTGPFAGAAGSRIRAKAVRYGWDESAEASARVGD